MAVKMLYLSHLDSHFPELAMHLVAINSAEPRSLEIGNKTVTTGIFKSPRKGPVAIGAGGVEGDNIVDTEVHGGVDQAVYLYSEKDYQWWAKELGRELLPGMFGENLTISSFHPQTLKIGDRLTIGDTLELEISAPRVPCAKFATKMGDPAFIKAFIAACRPGAYARVLTPGEVSAGDAIVWQTADEDYASVNGVFVEWHRKDYDRTVFAQALQSPVSRIARRIIEDRYL